MVKKKQDNLNIEEALQASLVPDWESPYKIPKNWVWTRLGNVCNFENGYAFKSSDYRSEGVPLLRISNIVNNSVDISECVYIQKQVDTRFLVKKGDLLIALSGATTGKNGVYPFEIPAYLNQRVGNIKIKSENVLLHRFRDFYIKEKTDEVLKNSYGGAQPNISPKDISSFSFPLPPIAEQQRIVDRIENLFIKLDEVKKLAQSALDSFETRKATILHKAFTGELTKKWREENRVELDSWEKTTLEQHTTKLGDGLHGTPVCNDDGEYYFINGNNLGGKNIIIKPDTKKVDVKEFDKNKKVINEKTVFVSINGTLGKTAFYNFEKIILGKSACYFNVADSLNKFFIRYFLETKLFIDYANETATGSTIKNLSLKAMRNLPINLPSIPEQTEIVRILDSIFAKEESAKELTDIIEKIDMMKKTILASAFRGELGTNNPKEKSAKELLKEILLAKKESEKKASTVIIKIPSEIDKILQTNIEREIYRCILKNKTADMTMFFNITKKFSDINSALFSLKKKDLIKEKNSKYTLK